MRVCACIYMRKRERNITLSHCLQPLMHVRPLNFIYTCVFLLLSLSFLCSFAFVYIWLHFISFFCLLAYPHFVTDLDTWNRFVSPREHRVTTAVECARCKERLDIIAYLYSLYTYMYVLYYIYIIVYMMTQSKGQQQQHVALPSE